MNAKTILVIAAAVFAGSIAADDCSSTQQTSAYTTLASLLTLDSFQGCVDDSGYSLLYSTSLPTDAEYVEMLCVCVVNDLVHDDVYCCQHQHRHDDYHGSDSHDRCNDYHVDCFQLGEHHDGCTHRNYSLLYQLDDLDNHHDHVCHCVLNGFVDRFFLEF
ncbi:Elicitin [Phytophthora palmivora]|uniref:Elicitin n=1 Tax=Phytophthora palmivora TaxID=4796 RepID=A0A2P4YS03_9STRA|nr:Elicitin [Phytophthora palmivora]